ncbi:hypothetical protein K4039_02630 [Lyngbya sp. CCAP 1446/10]|uniref:hypothetical protein n=1 Tax=Microcoleaceae TaxID=1892252 RepID=UPI0022377B15|nr:hypothetical protein [Lyngbya sp. CCAP 1446/10]MCW6049000.1 hypothetical protein [Lyngbya sp. CCAP 1446/10]
MVHRIEQQGAIGADWLEDQLLTWLFIPIVTGSHIQSILIDSPKETPSQKEEGRRKKEEGRRKREEGRGKRKEGRGKRE